VPDAATGSPLAASAPEPEPEPEPEVEPEAPPEPPTSPPEAITAREPAPAAGEFDREPELPDEPSVTADGDEEDAGPHYPEIAPPPSPPPAPTWGRRNRRGR
jgi:hypothetical protein